MTADTFSRFPSPVAEPGERWVRARVDLRVDGEALERPLTPWSR